MPKYIVKPGQTVTHGDQKSAEAHYEKMPKGMPFSGYPSAPVFTYEEGDEIELSEEEAAAMPHAVGSSEEYAELASPKAFIAKGYTQEQAEEKAKALKSASAKRADGRKSKKDQNAAVFGMQPTGNGEPNPINAGKFAEDGKPKK